MAENMIKFLRGNVASLPQVATAGAVYFTKDEGLYLGLADGTYHRYGDFIEVADVASLPKTGAHVKAMYYCTAENILAKWDGAKWVQINKQQTLAELGGVAESVYKAKIAALELADTANADAIAGVETRLQSAEDKLKSVATTEGLGELADTVEEHTAAIDTINGTVEKDGSMLKIAKDAADSKNAAIKEAKDAADKAQGDVDTLSQTHATDKASLEAAIALKANTNDVYTKGDVDGKIDTINGAVALKANAADVYTQDQIDEMLSDFEDANIDINNKIGNVADGKTIVEMIADVQSSSIYDDEEVRGLIDTNAQAIAKEIDDREGAIANLQDTLEDQISTKVEQSEYDDKVAELVAEDERLDGLVNGNAAAIEELSGEIDTIVGTDTGKSIRTIANEELAAQLIAENAADALDTLHEIATWIQEHPDSASAMNAAIEDLQDKVDTDDQTVSEYIATVIESLNLGDYAVATELTAAVERIDALEEVSDTHATKDELQNVSDSLDAYKTLHNSDYDNNAIDAKVKGVQDQIDTLGNIYATDAELTTAMNAEVERANGVYATKTTVDTHINNADVHVTIEDKAKWNGAQAAAEATAEANLTTARTEITTEIATAKGQAISDAEGKIATAKSEAIADAEGKIATAKSEVITDAEGKVNTAKSELQGKIDTVTGALNTYKTDNDAVVALKANTSDVYTKSEIEAMLTWAEF